MMVLVAVRSLCSSPLMPLELKSAKIIRSPNTIIETQNSSTRYKKDMTDFIMLDYISGTSGFRPKRFWKE